MSLPPLRAVHLTGPQSGWALADSALLHTDDGGASWTDLTPAALRGSTFGADMTLTSGTAAGLAFVGNSAAWIAAPSAGQVRIFGTTDNGRSWEEGSVVLPTRLGEPSDVPEVLALDFVNAKDGWLLTSLGAGAGSEPVEVYRTTDGGATWDLLATPTLGYQEPGGVAFSGDKTEIGFTDSLHGWLTGYSGNGGVWLYATKDAGAIWQRAKLPAPSGGAASDMFHDLSRHVVFRVCRSSLGAPGLRAPPRPHLAAKTCSPPSST